MFKKQDKAPAATTRRVDKRNRSLKTLSITSTILFMVLLLVFNIVFDSLLGDKLKWDWTPGGQYSIGDVTKEILGGLTRRWRSSDCSTPTPTRSTCASSRCSTNTPPTAAAT
jgi:hypothetical protein